MKLTEENTFEFFKQHSQVVVGEGRTFVYFPFWIEAKENELIVIDFENIPDSLKKSIENMRNGQLYVSVNKPDIFE